MSYSHERRQTRLTVWCLALVWVTCLLWAVTARSQTAPTVGQWYDGAGVLHGGSGVTLVDPASPSNYPNFVCASGCNSQSGSVTITAPLGTQTLGASVAVTDLSLQNGGAALTAIQAGTAALGANNTPTSAVLFGGQNSSAATTFTAVTIDNSSGGLKVLPSGLGTAGSAAGPVMSIQGVASMTPVATTTSAGTASGAHNLCTGQIKATATACGSAAAHNVYVYDLSNSANAATEYFQIFDTVVGSVSLGVTTPIYSIELAAGAHAVIPIAVGDSYVNQVTIACTTTATGSSAPPNNCAYNIIGK